MCTNSRVPGLLTYIFDTLECDVSICVLVDIVFTHALQIVEGILTEIFYCIRGEICLRGERKSVNDCTRFIVCLEHWNIKAK